MNKLLLASLCLLFFMSCGESTTPTNEEPTTDATTTSSEPTPEPEATNNSMPIEGVANILYQEFIFGKGMASSFRKSNQLFIRQEDGSYKLNKEDYQTTLEAEDEETFTTFPIIQKKTAKGVSLSDVSYNCKNCPETEDVYMIFSYIDELTVLALMTKITTEYDDGYMADTDFLARVYTKQGDTWVDVSDEALPSNLKEIFFQFFDENGPSDYAGNGVYSLDCASCLDIVLNDNSSIQIEAPESTKDGSNFIFLYEEGELFIP